MAKSLVFFPLFALGFLSGAVPPADQRATNPVDTNTHFFEERYATWPNGVTLAEWKDRREALRKQILTAAGLYPLPAKRTNPHSEIFGRKSYPGFTLEKVLIETSPGYWLGGNLWRPLTPGRHPAILSPHGHWNGGRTEQTDTGNVPARAVMLARMGFVVLTYDMVGYNDTKQTPHAFGTPAEQLWNWGPMGLQLWNSIRAADFLSALPDVDATRLAATGASGGGTQTFLLTAVDDRIRWSAPVNMVSGIMQGGSPCENGPGLRVGTFNVEIAAMMAPRPMLMVAATGDWTKNVPRQEYPAVKGIYALYDRASEVEAVQFDAPHNYNKASREAVYDFFARRILGLPNGPKETDIPEFSKADLLSLEGRELPAGALTYDQVFTQFRAGLPKGPVRERLLLALHAEWPATVESEEAGAGTLLGRPGKGDRVAMKMVGTGPNPVVVIHPAGLKYAENDPKVKELIAARRPVVLVEPYQGPSPLDKPKYYLTFQRSSQAEQTQDLLTVMRWLEQKGRKPELLGLEDGALWTWLAAQMAPAPPKQMSPAPQLPQTDEEWLKVFPAPGIRWAIH